MRIKARESDDHDVEDEPATVENVRVPRWNWKRLDRQLSAQMAVVGVTVAFLIAAAARLHAWSSDDVAVQVAMRTWSPDNSTLYFPEATWGLRVPLYAVTEWIFGSRASTLLIQSVALGVTSALLVFWSIRIAIVSVASRTNPQISVAKLGWIATLMTIWLFSLSNITTQHFMFPNYRGLNAGLICFGLVLATKRLSEVATEPVPRAIPRLVIPALWWAILAIDDPASMYTIVLPLALVAAVVLAMRRSPMARNALGLAIATILLWRLGLAFLRLVNVVALSSNPRIVEAAELPTTLANTADALAITFDVPVFGAMPQDLRLEVVGPQAFLVLLGMIAVIRHRKSLRSVPVVVGVALWALGVLVMYSFSSHGLHAENIRYVIFAATPLVGLLAAGLAASGQRPRHIMLALVVFVTAIHLVDSVRSTRTSDSPNQEAARLIEALAAADVERGYGDFWDTLGPSYFDESLTLVPIICVGGRDAFRRWFVDDSIARVQPNAERTAYIYSVRPGVASCPIESVKAQFGEPTETVFVTSDISLLIYEGDIGGKLAAPSPLP